MKGVITQFVAMTIISVGNFFTGYSVAWPSYALTVLEGEQSPIGTISKYEGNLVGSLPMLGSLLSTLVVGCICDHIGRKNTELLCGLCFVLAWSIQATAKNVILLLIGRFIIGVAGGAHFIGCLAFVSEICQDNLKGPMTTTLMFTYCFGTLVSYVTGWLLSYQLINYLNLTWSVLWVVLIVTILKETPAFLLQHGREKEALKSLKFYRGESYTTPDILDELAYLKGQNSNTNTVSGPVRETLKLNDEKFDEGYKTHEKDISAWRLLCTSKSNQRAVFLTTTNAVLLVFGGTIAVQAYAGPLFTRAAPALSPHMCSIILSVAFAAGSLLSTVVGGFLQRRILMITSALTSALFLGVLASLVRWSWGPQWMVPGAVLAYCSCFQLGVANVPFVQLSESFVPKMKSLTSMIVSSAMCIANFVVLALFSPTVDLLGLDGTFLMFSFICAATGLLAFLTMKETKGRTVEEIQEMYAKGLFNCNG
ncbi:facilitated trehalose transporter Tret1-2 homolog [Pectinophora gossypiella]|uniref:facilitated trehalose transporter Tret1-2 homolog n=1 Tax=Pectinophora gossypiella TaxID=13191 RepID=UPI00214E4663|nr:facilitated trehalose transporter Tret1-2 homolog [Pectinophora gossypiella]